MLITNILTFLQSEAEKAKVKSTPVIVLYYPVSLKFCFLIVNILYVIPKDSYEIFIFIYLMIYFASKSHMSTILLSIFILYISLVYYCVW